MAHVVNVSTRVFPLEIGTAAGKPSLRVEMKPGDVVDIDAAYGTRRVPNPSAESIPSIVELLTNGNILPASDPRSAAAYKAWLEKQSSAPAPVTTAAPVVTAEAASAPIRPAKAR